MIDTKLIGGLEYKLSLLSGGDEAYVQSLCERCSDFSKLMEGEPPGKDAGKDILFDLPPGKELKDKYVLGIYKEEDLLIGVIEMVKNFKTLGEWTIGLFMMDPSERGKGLGRKVHEIIRNWVFEKGGRKLRIGVIEENDKGHIFWCKMGYVEVDRVKRKYGNKEHSVIVMELLI